MMAEEKKPEANYTTAGVFAALGLCGGLGEALIRNEPTRQVIGHGLVGLVFGFVIYVVLMAMAD
jgi:hypothetical protein